MEDRLVERFKGNINFQGQEQLLLFLKTAVKSILKTDEWLNEGTYMVEEIYAEKGGINKKE